MHITEVGRRLLVKGLYTGGAAPAQVVTVDRDPSEVSSV